MRSRGWIIVINNYDDDDICAVTSLYYWYNWNYVLIGFEKGDRNKTPHLQCYCYSKNRPKHTTINKILPNAHIEPEKSNSYSNQWYCRTDGDYIELGTRPRQGKRSDLDIMYLDIKHEKKTWIECCDQYGFKAVQYYRPIQQLCERFGPIYKTVQYIYDDDTIENMYLLYNSMREMECYIYNPLTATKIATADWQYYRHILYSGRYAFVFVNYDSADMNYHNTVWICDKDYYLAT